MAWGESEEWYLLLEFSEWLDTNKYMIVPDEDDELTHENFVDMFTEQSELYKERTGL